MVKRIISSLVALPLLFFIVLKGGNYILISAFIINIIGLYEFYASFKNTRTLNIISYVITLAVYMILYLNYSSSVYMFLIVLFMASLFVSLVFSKHYSIKGISITLLGFFYVTFSISHIIMLNKVDSFFIWYIFILAWVTDTFAYFSGSLFGKRKLVPEISPKKTIEGSIGGIIGAVLASYAYSLMFNKEFLLFSIFLGLFGSIFSQIGDLVASKFKRINKIKDFGSIMPGHGGVLDRFDSIIFVAPLVYYITLLYQYMIK